MCVFFVKHNVGAKRYFFRHNRVSELCYNIPPTYTSYKDKNLSLKSHPKDWRSGESNLRTLDWWSLALCTTAAPSGHKQLTLSHNVKMTL